MDADELIQANIRFHETNRGEQVVDGFLFERPLSEEELGELWEILEVFHGVQLSPAHGTVLGRPSHIARALSRPRWFALLTWLWARLSTLARVVLPYGGWERTDRFVNTTIPSLYVCPKRGHVYSVEESGFCLRCLTIS